VVENDPQDFLLGARQPVEHCTVQFVGREYRVRGRCKAAASVS
jgi:hypothetical protein